MEYCQGQSQGQVSRRDSLLDTPLQTSTQQEFSKELTLSGSADGSSSKAQGRTRILRASEVLLSLAGRRSMNDILDEGPGIENFQEALRIFPPFRDDDGYMLGAVEARCPDCEAVFSSTTELEQHYLTRYCPGSAVAVYVMTRDRLITKGYRMEKRLVAFDCRPLRFFCGKCERAFAIDETERVDRLKRTAFVACKNCGEKCNISYEPVLNDPRDSGSFREVSMDLTPAVHGCSRSSSVTPRNITPRSVSRSKAPMSTNPNGTGELFFSKKARKIRDSWATKKLEQEEDELVAISFAGLYDLERVHAPNGVFQSIDDHIAGPLGGMTMSAPDGVPLIDKKPLTLCAEGNGLHRDISVDSRGDLLVAESRDSSLDKNTKRQSLFQKLFGRKTKGLSRAKSTSNRGKKLLKRVNTVRFSFISRESKHSSGKNTPRSTMFETEQARQALESKEDLNSLAIPESEYIALLRDSQDIFVHMQYLSGAGAVIVHDASGRQRILQMDEVAQLFLQLKDEVAAATTWSKMLSCRVRGESALKQGNLRAAVVEYHDALRMLQETPGLDVDKLVRAAMLHAMGHAYRGLNMAAESEMCYLESLGLYKRALGRDHPKNFEILHDIGTLCEKDGYATEAAALYERSFAGRLKTLGHNAPETLNSMQDLASLKDLLGDLESALLLLEKAVPALETVFGAQNGTTLDAMNKLSQLYQKLGLNKESRTISGRTIPHCKTFFGLNSPVTRDTVIRYLQSSDNFDFPADIKDILEQYRRSRDPESLKVIHQLGRSYMSAGLNRDAADLFEGLVDDFLAVKGPEALDTFHALSALCVSREHVDSIEKAIHAYKQLVHMARKTPEDHYSRKKIGYAEKRISELNHRREILAAERIEWGLNQPGPCRNCNTPTPRLCNSCKITRFCSEPCHAAAIEAHIPSCIPSVSLRESKSLAVKPICPAQDQALLRIRCSDPADISVLNSYTFYLDPRNFTTFRMKFRPEVNTVILFSQNSDVKFAMVDSVPAPAAPFASTSTSTSTSTEEYDHEPNQNHLNWLTPTTQDCISFNPRTDLPTTTIPSNTTNAQSRYLLVTPGNDMLKSIIDKRVHARSGGNGSGGRSDGDRFRSLDVPSMELIEYAQGLHLTGYMGEPLMYVIEWKWK